MKYFIDTEFLEGTQKKTFLGFYYGDTPPTIDLISIGIVAEYGKEYYAISKDFNLRQAWEDEWIVNNVLLPIFRELSASASYLPFHGSDFNYRNLKWLIDQYGKTNKQIAAEIIEFCSGDIYAGKGYAAKKDRFIGPEFWAYYADYDWVVFCQLFGRMIDLPKGFPMYCRDLKQLMDEKVQKNYIDNPNLPVHTFENAINWLKEHSAYPKQQNEHNALSDAKWNKKLYEFLTTFKK